MAAGFTRVVVKVVTEFAADLNLISADFGLFEEFSEHSFGPTVAVGVTVIEIGNPKIVTELAQFKGAFISVVTPPVYPENPAAQRDGGHFNF